MSFPLPLADSPPDSDAPRPDEARPSEAPRIVDSAELLGSARELLIRHGNEVYRLRRTRHDRLILHK